jgi:TRAP-type C4-dicarboxylate transport system permease small subunit
MRSTRRARPTAYVVVLVCLALLALLTFIQVAHVHSVNTDADHCPICVVLHTAAPIAVAAAIIILVEMQAFVSLVEVRPIRAHCQRQLFIRPPPSI